MGFLDDLTLKELAAQKTSVLTVSGDVTVTEVLSIMETRNITSVPVTNAVNKCVGIVSIVDILVYATLAVNDTKAALSVAEREKKLSLSIKDLIGITDEGKTLWKYSAAAKLTGALEAFSKGVHRILVEDDQSHQTAFVSQSDVVRFLHQHIGKLDQAVTSTTLKNCGFVPSDPSIVTSDENRSAHEAFRKMVLHDVSAVAVVDDSGVLVGNLSGSDLRGLTAASMSAVDQPIKAFLAARGRAGVVSTTADATLKDVITILVNEKIHRVWVVGADKKPIGVVTLSDVICKFQPFDWKRKI